MNADGRAAAEERSDGAVSPGIPMSCLADTLAAAESVVEGLGGAGFAGDRISIVFAESAVGGDQFEGKHSGTPSAASARPAGHWLHEVRRLVVTGCGTFFASGPVAATLAGDALGMTERSIGDALMRLGLPEARARQCEQLVCAGCILIAAHDDDPELVSRATSIAGNAGAQAVAAGDDDPRTRAIAVRHRKTQRNASKHPESAT